MLTKVRMQMEGQSKQTMQWSPCSRFISLFVWTNVGGKLCVMNTHLDVLYSTTAYNDALFFLDVQSAWSPDCTFVGARLLMPQKMVDPMYVLDMCWDPTEPDPSTGEAAMHARALLEGMDAREYIDRLAWGAGNAFAVVSELPQVRSHGDAGVKQPCRARQSKLYVLLPGCELASMLLPEHFGSCGALNFSPSGRHLLVGCGSQGNDLHLVTSSCKNLVSFPQSTAAFSPDGALMAVVGAAVDSDIGLSLVRCADGRQIFSMVCSNLPGQHLCFNALGNQLTLSSRIICFGLDDDNTAKGRQLCRAISASSSWASSKLQDGVV